MGARHVLLLVAPIFVVVVVVLVAVVLVLLVVLVLRGLDPMSRVIHSTHFLTIPGPAECAKRLNKQEQDMHK